MSIYVVLFYYVERDSDSVIAEKYVGAYSSWDKAKSAIFDYDPSDDFDEIDYDQITKVKDLPNYKGNADPNTFVNREIGGDQGSTKAVVKLTVIQDELDGDIYSVWDNAGFKMEMYKTEVQNERSNS